MKKIYRVTYRCDQNSRDGRNLFSSQINKTKGVRANGSEIYRAVFQVLFKDKKLRSMIIRAVVKCLKESK